MTFDEQGQLIFAAASLAIRQALEDGRRQGYNGEWLEQTQNAHLNHAEDHLLEWRKTEEWSHLEHALTRLSMALALAKMQD